MFYSNGAATTVLQQRARHKEKSCHVAYHLLHHNVYKSIGLHSWQLHMTRAEWMGLCGKVGKQLLHTWTFIADVGQ